ncbi:hypothetical protein BACCOPRO_00117 [Phocaeicola coprophilus DSM 18228 = JCM 13818]|uniref:Uncharacterized protein n=1 Tax=Phocaeicola coprophilus DSM 18228 = JCM 13818 TaxID=547042 RepID=S0F595_9BACT|nr:hypothetical protein BACCOPRO_00117 [Phocaeicola coprophilus DSM 18228 = JCM 13818]
MPYKGHLNHFLYQLPIKLKDDAHLQPGIKGGQLSLYNAANAILLCADDAEEYKHKKVSVHKSRTL